MYKENTDRNSVVLCFDSLWEKKNGRMEMRDHKNLYFNVSVGICVQDV